MQEDVWGKADTVTDWNGGLLSLGGYRPAFQGNALPYTPPRPQHHHI